MTLRKRMRNSSAGDGIAPTQVDSSVCRHRLSVGTHHPTGYDPPWTSGKVRFRAAVRSIADVRRIRSKRSDL
jgi:hypothetical protein